MSEAVISFPKIDFKALEEIFEQKACEAFVCQVDRVDPPVVFTVLQAPCGCREERMFCQPCLNFIKNEIRNNMAWRCKKHPETSWLYAEIVSIYPLPKNY